MSLRGVDSAGYRDTTSDPTAIAGPHSGRVWSVTVHCGIGWADGDHEVAPVDTDGRLVARRRNNEGVDGVAELTSMPLQEIPGRPPVCLAGWS